MVPLQKMPRILPEYREEVRKKIVQEAFALFQKKGYHGTTMGEIAERLNVTKPALYQYFPGKEDLYAAVAEKGREELVGILERSYDGNTLFDGNAALFDNLIKYVPEFHWMYSEMMILAAHNDQLRDILHRDRAEDLRAIERFIASQQKRGLVSDRLDSRVLAVACDALINGLLMDMMMGMEIEEAKKTWLAAVSQLIRIL